MVPAKIDGRYVVHDTLGSGGNGLILRAEDAVLGRAVAIKVLPDALRHTTESVARLEREGRIAGSLSHPNICAVTGIGRLDDGSPYIVMELLQGETLARKLDQGRVHVTEALEIADQILAGLEAAHAQGVVHRDVKPANVFLVPLGPHRHLVKLLDFGLAQKNGAGGIDDHQLTGDGLVVGTVRYMAPEQVRGVRTFDARTDVYAVGVLLFEMLTGEHPFGPLSSQALIEAIAFQKPPRIESRLSSLAPAISSAIDTALAPERERRHSSAATFRRALHAPPPISVSGTTAIIPTKRSAELDAVSSGIEVVFEAEADDPATSDAALTAKIRREPKA